MSTLTDLVADEFVTDSDLDECLDMYARGFISKAELSDRLEFLLHLAENRAQRKLYGACEPDDPYAKAGAWDDSSGDEHEKGVPA